MDLLKKIFKDNASSKEVAVERLRLVLVHDRADISPGLLELLKEEMIQVITKYMEIDQEAMDVTLNSTDHSAALIASIPVKRIKRQSGTAL